ncbi:hypothetical protein AncyloWKF20_09515 [Ancylobacter sp. WKF20]|uniref:hypothetical protein n=1 Tax=Ancylobacter sp. WKF20 TaxID=3039801 RepID=UPI0024343648|nr:hypothetical protein [Ancylobacter sp. WKF20]WGD32030.1 hypothetical protein AncyloWKF20_09515 [Ancylobacter sp. WKF20]
MFEVGKHYEFRCIEDGSECTFWGAIERYEHPLIKLMDTPPMRITIAGYGSNEVANTLETRGSKGKIINVTSLNFVSAVERPAETIQASEEDAQL